MHCLQLAVSVPPYCFVGGFIAVEEILGLEEFQKKNATVEDIERVVANNDKQRFALKDDNGMLYIRANQGHTMDVVDLELEEIHSAEETPVVVHGTYHKAFDAIKRQVCVSCVTHMR